MNRAVTAIPKGRLSASTDDRAAAEQRRIIAQRLASGQTVNINSAGVVHAPGQNISAAPVMQAGGRIVNGEVELAVPQGKLA